MIMKRLTILVALATMIFAGCNNVREKVLPQVSGKAGEVVIVIEAQ